MAQVSRNVREREVLGAEKLNGRTLEKGKMLLADETGVLNSFVANVVNVGAGTDDTDIIGVRLECVECDVCLSATSVEEHLRCPINARIPIRER